MNFDLKNRDCIGELIAYVKLGSTSFYCIAAVEYWIGHSWYSYIDKNKGELAIQYFKFIKQFKINYEDLQSGYLELIELGDIFELEGNKPQLYIDFGEKYFASYFQEQELENRTPINWTSEYRKIENLIPEEFKYWENHTSV